MTVFTELWEANAVLNQAVSFHLFIDELDNNVNNLIRRNSKVFWGRIIGIDHARDGLGEEGLLAVRVLHEVQTEHIIEVGAHLVLIVKVKIIVKLGKFEDNLDGLGLVISREASMLPALKDSRTALVDEVGANRVLSMVKALVEALLLGQEDHSAVVLRRAGQLT